jgi:hypothetical protein
MTTITLPRQDYISVRYAGGAGGTFLTSWLTAAKQQNPAYVSLTSVGSADPATLEIQESVPHTFRAEQHKQFLSTVVPGAPNTEPPYFLLDMGKSIDDSLECVQRVINISFDIDDVDDVAWCYYKKTFMRQDNVDLLSVEDILDQLTETIGCQWIKFRAKTDTARVCYIKWKDLLNGDSTALINKLSQFTGIHMDNFDVTLLNEWRTATQALIASRGTE